MESKAPQPPFAVQTKSVPLFLLDDSVPRGAGWDPNRGTLGYVYDSPIGGTSFLDLADDAATGFAVAFFLGLASLVAPDLVSLVE